MSRSRTKPKREVHVLDLGIGSCTDYLRGKVEGEVTTRSYTVYVAANRAAPGGGGVSEGVTARHRGTTRSQIHQYFM